MKNALSKLSYEILKISNRDIPRSVFLKEISNVLLDWLKCSELKFLLKMQKNESQFELAHYTNKVFEYKIINKDKLSHHLPEEESVGLWEAILENKFDNASTFFTEKGTFWTINFGNLSIPYRRELGSKENKTSKQNHNYSLLIIPFLYSNERVGLLQVKNIKQEIFSSIGTNLFEEFAQTLSAILINQYTQALLQERVKELTFLYEMSTITKLKTNSLDDILYHIIELIPPAWQYPEITQAKITLNGVEYANKPIEKCEHTLVADIIIENERRGTIEVSYAEKCPDIDEGPFFHEERSLLNNIATELANIITQRNKEKQV